jgi:cytochrome P450 family 135
MWPGFCPERTAAIEPGIAELVASHAAGWPVLRPFRLLEAMRSQCTEVTVRLVLGVSDLDRGARLIDAIRRMLNTPGNPPLPLLGGDDGLGGAAGWAGDAIFARPAAPVRDLLLGELHERRLNGAPGDDVFSAMLRPPEIDDEAIVDQLLIVLMAAQEPRRSR